MIIGALSGLGLQTCCLATFLAMFLPGRRRKLLGREGYFREAEQVRKKIVIVVVSSVMMFVMLMKQAMFRQHDE